MNRLTESADGRTDVPPLDWDPIPLSELLQDAVIVKSSAPDEGQGASPDVLVSRSGFFAAFDAALALAAERDVRELWLCDPDFSSWPMGLRSTIERLDAWIGPHRRLRVLACDFNWLSLECPRWVAWRRRWAHVVDCLAVSNEDAPHMRSLLLVPGHQVIQLVDAQRGRGRILRASEDLTGFGELVEDLLQRAEAAMPPTTLGL